MSGRSSQTDNTALFRACVKAIKLRQSTKQRLRSKSPTEGEVVEVKTEEAGEPPVEQETPLPASPNFPLYSAHARQIGQHIRELADLVVERRKSYLLSTVSAYGHDELMSDSDRRHFDADTDLAMRQCSKLVRNLEFQVDNDATLRKDDEHPHLKAITLLLNVYLKNVCKMVAELRAMHLKKSQHFESNLSARQPRRHIEGLRAGAEAKRRELRRRQAEVDRRLKGEPADEFEPEGSGEHRTGQTEGSRAGSPSSTSRNSRTKTAENVEPHSPTLDSAEQTQLTIENRQLLERFVQQNSEIEQIEKHFAELQRLQQTFVEKVVEQEKDIEIIHQKTIHTLDNLDQANQFIRDAIKNSASRRVIALFCLIVLTFTLLFLDWYNP
ncbi:hypothetical protein M3Y99_01595000 [Aphelenchoides fujianensis]|nr:hypothetical protein M3Y99_01595000 [Aphelenchoides fujianensis]